MSESVVRRLKRQLGFRPCPFCGSTPLLSTHRYFNDWHAWICCNNCRVETRECVDEILTDAVAAVINIWNRRVGDKDEEE